MPDVVDVPERSRFEIRVEGEVAGFAEYRRRPGVIAFIHTLIDPRFEGQGLASRLVRTALSEARSDGSSVLPFCPFVRAYIAAHSECLDLVPEDIVLGLRQPLPEVEERRAQLLNRCERELHLGLDADGPGDPKLRPGLDRVLEQCGLADARLAMHHQHAALPGAHAVQQPVEHLALAFAAEQRPS